MRHLFLFCHQLLQQNLVTDNSTGPTKIGQLMQQLQRSMDGVSSVSSTSATSQPTLALSTSIPITSAMTSPQKNLQLSISQMTQALLSASAVSQTAQPGCDNTAVVSIPTTGSSAGMNNNTNGVTPNINQLLPSKVESEIHLGNTSCF